MQFYREIKVGELIRHQRTREVFIVVDKSSQGIMIVSLSDNTSPKPILMVLPAYGNDYVRDTDIYDLDVDEKIRLEDELKKLNKLDD